MTLLEFIDKHADGLGFFCALVAVLRFWRFMLKLPIE